MRWIFIFLFGFNSINAWLHQPPDEAFVRTIVFAVTFGALYALTRACIKLVASMRSRFK